MQSSAPGFPSDPQPPNPGGQKEQPQSPRSNRAYRNSLDLPPLAEDPVVQRARAKAAAASPKGRQNFLIDMPQDLSIAGLREFLLRLEKLPDHDPAVWSAREQALDELAFLAAHLRLPRMV